MSLATTVRNWNRRVFGSPAYDRLANFIADAWADFDREVHNAGHSAIVESWARSAHTLLLRAESHLAMWEIEGGWTAALAAQRAILSNPHNPERLKRAAIALRREADKITGWRAKAIEDLICASDGELLPFAPEELSRVIDAVALRDDFSQNTWFKILLRKRHLFILSVILWTAIAMCLLLSWREVLPDFLRPVGQVSTVILFGVLGAAVSVAQSLVAEDVSRRIPTQESGAVVIWTRPGIGAAASLVVFALLNANHIFGILGNFTTEPPVIVAFSFLAGYSERFIIGALARLSDSAVKDK